MVSFLVTHDIAMFTWIACTYMLQIAIVWRTCYPVFFGWCRYDMVAVFWFNLVMFQQSLLVYFWFYETCAAIVDGHSSCNVIAGMCVCRALWSWSTPTVSWAWAPASNPSVEIYPVKIIPASSRVGSYLLHLSVWRSGVGRREETGYK